MGLKERYGVDLGVFKESTTWKAFLIGLVLFCTIGYAGLSMFDLASSSYGVDRDNIRLAPDFEIETFNRSTEEGDYVNETGWFRLSDHRGKVVILDFMAVDCANCHLVQEHLEAKRGEWAELDGDHEVLIVSIGSWYQVIDGEPIEDMDKLYSVFGDSSSDSHMPWVVGTGADDSVFMETVNDSGVTLFENNSTNNEVNGTLSEETGTHCLSANIAIIDDVATELCFKLGPGQDYSNSTSMNGIDVNINVNNNSVSWSIDVNYTNESNYSLEWQIVSHWKGDMVEQYQAQGIPVALVIDHEGYIVAKEASGTPTGGWGDFDDAVVAANGGDAESLRFSLAKVDRSPGAIFTMGLLLGVLVYFSPCAFPILPGYISYYINLAQREDELMESGKLDKKMPPHYALGGLAALGQLTFFGIIAVIVFGLGSIIDLSGTLHYFALAVAILLIVLGAFMLTGGTAHLLGFVQKLVDKYSTTEMDDKFTPKRNMYLWGIGYSAASIDCTAAAVIPFIGYLALIGGVATWTGLGGLMLSVSLLMVAVTTIVGLGQQQFITVLRRSTGLIKATGAWMMMMAGIGLTFYLTQPELIASWLA